MTAEQIIEMNELLHDVKMINRRLEESKNHKWIGISAAREEGEPFLSEYAQNKLDDFLTGLEQEITDIIAGSKFEPYASNYS